MVNPAVPPIASDDQVREMLKRYRCPVPFHAVRKRFLGNIASPRVEASPIKVVEDLWGGHLPPFESLGAVNELIGGLVMGLWNGLVRHQERSAPFRLTRIDVPTTREGLGILALTRREELDGFVEGVFGHEDSLDLPKPAHKGFKVLAEIRAMTDASHEVALNPSKPGTVADGAETLELFRRVTRVAEHEIHGIVVSCTRTRRQKPLTLSASGSLLN